MEPSVPKQKNIGTTHFQIGSRGGALPKKAPTRLNSMRQSHTHSTPKVFLRKVPFPLYEKTGANEQKTPGVVLSEKYPTMITHLIEK